MSCEFVIVNSGDRILLLATQGEVWCVVVAHGI